MTAKKEAGAERPSPRHILVRTGRYIGNNGHAFDSIPWGERLHCQTGKTYDVSEAFAYIWTDPMLSHQFEWEGEPHYVDLDAPKEAPKAT